MDTNKNNAVSLNDKLLNAADKYIAEHKKKTPRQQVEDSIDALKVMRDEKKLSFAQITEIYKANGVDVSHVIIRDVYKQFNASKPAAKRKDKTPKQTVSNASSTEENTANVKSNSQVTDNA